MERRKVLLVDDEFEFASTLAERLRLRRMEVDTAASGEAALRLVADDPPQVVVLDVMMPGLGGLEVMKRIRTTHPQVQIILLTGMSGAIETDEARRRGAYECLMKPVNIDELIKVIGEAVAAGDRQ